MKLNRCTQHAIAMLTLLSKNGSTMSTSSIAEQLCISWRYLKKISGPLKEAGLVEVMIGPNGGYRLIRDAKTINIYKIIITMEGVPYSSYVESTFEVKQLNMVLSELVTNILQEITIADLSNKLKGVDELLADL